MMRLTLCFPRKLMQSLLSLLRDWKNVLIIVLLMSFTVVAIVQKYWVAARLQLLLEYDLSESPTRQQSNVLRMKMAFQSRIETTCTNDSDVDNGVDFYKPSKCPRSISSLSNYSQWFRKRFKPNIKLFLDKLDAENIKNLSFYELPFGFKDENHDFIESLLCHKNFKNSPLSLRDENQCISCAVVGSGGILNGSHAGEEIDAHDVVFRFNAAVTYGKHGKDVGRRTDFYMFFPESAHLYGLREKNVTLLYTMYKSFDVKYVAEILDINRRRKSQKVNPERLKIIHPDFFRYIFAKYLDARSMKPTTGAIGVMLAVHLCDSVTIYGFGYDPRFSMYYYDGTFTKHVYKATWAHDVENEKKLWDKLHHEGVIRFFKRDVM